jgi:protein gp37
MFTEQRRYGHDPEVVRRSKTLFGAPLGWHEPRRVFTCSWSDWFIPTADGWRAEAWDVIRRTPHLTYQILTKRPELIRDRLPADWGTSWRNVWLGTSVENRRFIWRAETLSQVPAFIRFISAEPLLGALDLAPYLASGRIQWVIVGGESGPHARPCRVEWMHDLVDQCREAGVACFVKQLGAVLARGNGERGKGGDLSTWPDSLRVREMPRS